MVSSPKGKSRLPCYDACMKSRIANIMLIFWELPQDCLGLGLLALLRTTGKVGILARERQRLFITAPISVSLGYFIFHCPVDRIKDHEWGHSIQSRMLGPLYLIVVGIPSLSRAVYAIWYERRHHKRWTRYFSGFPESWADKLAGLR